MKTLALACTVGALACLLPLSSARANIVINGTRVIYPAQQRDITVRLENEGKLPSLVQAWVDSGNPQSRPDTAHAPFLITPPLFRIDPHKAQSLRIIFTHANLPKDRESLFWLNVLEIPPKPKTDQGKNYLQLAIRTRLKLFYRPAGLTGNPRTAPEKLTWHVAHGARGWSLRVDNPTPYHVTITSARVDVAGKPVRMTSGMVDPDAKLNLKAKKGSAHAPAPGAAVSYKIINDYGAVQALKGTVAP